MLRWFAVLAIGIAVVAGPPLVADCSKPGACNTEIIDTLDFDNGACLDGETRRYINYLVQVPSAGQNLSFSVSSPFFPPAIRLINPNLDVVAADENGSSVAYVRATSTIAGTWTVQVRNISVGDGGQFKLIQYCSTAPPPPPPPPQYFHFRVTVTPRSLSLARSQTIQVQIETIVDDLNAPVMLSASAPLGFSATIDSAVIPAPGSGKATLTITTGDTAAGGDHIITVTGQGGSYTRTVDVTVTVLFSCKNPYLLKQPSNPTIRVGETTAIEPNFNGSQPIRFEWFEGAAGSDLHPQAETGPKFLVPPHALPGDYYYWFRAQNECGSMQSGTVTVHVLPAPPHRHAARR